MTERIVNSMYRWDPAAFGLPPGEEIGVNTSEFSAVDRGDSGVLFIDNEYVRAVGISGVGGRSGPNEDGIAISAGLREEHRNTLLFGLADGMGGREAGKLASTVALQGMCILTGGYWSFQEALHSVAQRMNEPHLKRDMGTTYAGLLFHGVPRKKPRIGIIGDSRVVVSERGKPLYASTSHGKSYVHARRTDDLVQAIYEAGNPDAVKWLKAVEGISRDRFVEAARMMYEFIYPSGIIYRSVSPHSRCDIEVDDVPRRRGLKYIMYSDGVGNLFTPVDVAAAFPNDGTPIHLQAIRFAQDVMQAQRYGRSINVGVGPPVFISGIRDNFSLWAIRVK